VSSRRIRKNEDQANCQRAIEAISGPQEIVSPPAIARSQKRFDKKKSAAPKQGANHKRYKRHLENALGNHKRLEGHRKRSNRGKKDRRHWIVLNILSNSAWWMALSFAVIGLTASSRDPVNPDASHQRANGGHCGVIRHAQWVTAGQLHQQ
jgi:hypothetical protein